jgi:RNA polymerase sigma-70 factor, ECF subfamily
MAGLWKNFRNWTTHSFRSVGPSMPLSDLLAGARPGEPRCIGELYRRHRPAVLAFLQRLVPDDAEDLAQEVFLTLPAKLAGYQERGAFEAWLKRVAFNVYRTRRRSAERRREEALEAEPPVESRESMGQVTREDLWAHAVLGMPESLREVWVLHREGYEARELAELLEISPGAAATRLSRARDYLSGRLTDLA